MPTLDAQRGSTSGALLGGVILLGVIALVAWSLIGPTPRPVDDSPGTKQSTDDAPAALPPLQQRTRAYQLPPLPSAPEQDAPLAVLAGTILSEAAVPLPGVRLSLWTEGLEPTRTVSDTEGRYRFEVPAGRYLLVVESQRHPARVSSLVLREGRTRQDPVLIEGNEVYGTVRTPAGKPLPGAVITAGGAGVVAPRESTSAEDGRFRLAGLPAGPVLVEARLPGWDPPLQRRPVDFAPGFEGHLEKLELTFAPGARLMGEVVDATSGRPLAGVTLRIHGTVARFGAIEGTSDAEGGFRLGGLPSGQAVIEASKPHWVQDGPIRRWLGSGETSTVTVPMVETAGVAGRITDPPDASEVQVFAESLLGGPPTSVRTDDRGRFRVSDLRPGWYRLRARHADFQDTWSAELHLLPGRVMQDVFIALEPGAELSGRVLGLDGEPAPGAEITAWPEGHPDRRRRFRSDPRGEFRLAGLSAGPTVITVRDAEQGARVIDRILAEREMRAGLEWRLVEPRRVSGQLVGPEGEPIAGAWIGAWGHGTGAASARSTGRGTFRLGNVGQPPFRIQVLAPGYLPLAATVEEGGATKLSLTRPGGPLSPTGLLRGRVVDAGGQPVAHAFVSARWQPAVQVDEPAFVGMADAEGRFGLEVTPGRRYGVRGWPSDRALPGTVGASEVVVVPEAGIDLELVLLQGR